VKKGKALKKVLLIGPACFNYNQSIAAAFDPDNFDVSIIDYAEQHGRINLLNKISYFVSTDRIAMTSKLLEELNSFIVSFYHQIHPDIVLIIKGEVITAETLSAMTASKNVLWMLDSIHYFPQALKLVDQLDAVFLFEKTDEEKFKKLNKNAFYLPPAYDDRIFKKLSIKKDIDILFIGTLYKSRLELLERMHTKFPQSNMKVYCERYRFYKTPGKYLKSLGDNTFINRFVTPIEANLLYNRARICLNMHHEQSVYGINPRFFEILGANGFQVVDHKPYIHEHFPGKAICTYRNEEELFERIGHHLKNNQDKNYQELYDEVAKNHTYRNRVSDILERI